MPPKYTTEPNPVDRFRDLHLQEQRRLVASIARRRARQLRDRYPDILALWTGNRSRGDRVTTDPCLIFVVQAKRPESKLAAANVLPKTVLAYTTIDGHRRRTLIPTDVLEVASFAGATPDGAPSPVEALVPGQPVREGQLCCAVRRPPLPDSLIAISCRHVLTSGADLAADRFSDARLFLVNDAAEAPHVADATKRGGQIVTGSAGGPFSFDAQLAIVNPAAHDRLRAALGDVDLAEQWPKSKAELSLHDAWIQTRRGPLEVRLLGCGPSVEPVNHDGVQAFHEELIAFELKDGGRTREGDSGSAVTAERNGGLLLGMHIASDGKEPQKAYAIPAWRLLRPQSYPGGVAGETWQLVRASGLPALAAPPVAGAALAAVPAGLAAPPVVPGGTLSDAYRNTFANFAMAAATQLAGQAPVSPSVVAAQCILESAWGTSQAARIDNAYFGIKATGAFAGRVAVHPTTENFAGGPVQIVDQFRAYDNWWHSFLDYGHLIRTARRYERTRAASGNRLAYVSEIKAAGYATDPDYVQKIRQVINSRPAILGGPI